MKVVILDDVRSAQNVGSIFRTSSGIGVDKIILCGITPIPFETGAKFLRQNKKRKDFIKTSLGSEDEITWEYRENTLNLVKELKKQNFEIIALEQAPNSVDYKDIKIENQNVAIILGNEVSGIASEVLAQVDQIAEIPMRGKKESLNVAIVFAILAYRFWDR